MSTSKAAPKPAEKPAEAQKAPEAPAPTQIETTTEVEEGLDDGGAAIDVYDREVEVEETELDNGTRVESYK